MWFQARKTLRLRFLKYALRTIEIFLCSSFSTAVTSYTRNTESPKQQSVIRPTFHARKQARSSLSSRFTRNIHNTSVRCFQAVKVAAKAYRFERSRQSNKTGRRVGFHKAIAFWASGAALNMVVRPLCVRKSGLESRCMLIPKLQYLSQQHFKRTPSFKPKVNPSKGGSHLHKVLHWYHGVVKAVLPPTEQNYRNVDNSPRKRDVRPTLSILRVRPMIHSRIQLCCSNTPVVHGL